LFYLDLSLFYIIVISFLSNLLLASIKYISGTNIGWSSLEAKERGLGADSGWKNTRFSTEIRRPQVRSLARPVPNVARSCHPPDSLLLLLLRLQATLFCSLGPQFLVEHSGIIVA